MIFLFKTQLFEGELIKETAEGKVNWIDEEKLSDKKLSKDFEILLKLFNEKHTNETGYKDNNSKDEKIRWDLFIY